MPTPTTARTRHAAPAFLALSCIGGFASGAHADPLPSDPVDPAAAPDPLGDDQLRPEDVVVNGLREQKEKDPKQTAKLVDTPRSIVVLPREVIEQTGSASLQDALRTIPGITFGAAEGGNPVGDRPFIRGFDSQGSTYVDGVRDFSAQSREVFAVQEIQVVRGSDSTLGGRGSAGGTINIISRLPQQRNFETASASFGNADYKRVSVDVNRRLSDTAAVRIEGLWHDQNVAGRDAVYAKRWGIAPSVAIGLGTPTRLTIAGYYLESHELPDSGIPYLYTTANAPLGTSLSQPAIGNVTLANGQTGHVARTTFYGLTSRDFRYTQTTQATARVEHDFGGLTLRNTSRFTHNVQNYIYTQPDDSQGNVFGTTTINTATATGANLTSGGYVWRRANTRYGYADALTDQVDLYGSFKTGGIAHSIAVGAEVDWEKARRGTYVTRGYLNATGTEILSQGSTIAPRCTTASIARYYCTSLFAPNPNDPWVNYASDTSAVASPIVKTLTQEETQQEGYTQSVYGFDSITLLPALILNLGARYDHFTSRLTPGQAVTATSNFTLRREDSLFNWQAGLVLKPTTTTSLYASYATSATPANSLLGEGQEGSSIGTTNTAANLALIDNLQPEKTRSYEVGAKGDLLDHRLNLSLALFQTDTDNARVTDANNNVAFIGRRRIRGVELGVNGQILPGWTVFGGYTHLDPRIVDGGTTALTAAAITQTANGVTRTIQAAKIVNVPSVNTGRQATQTAADSFTSWTNVTFLRRFQLGGGAFYTSRVYGGYADNRSATQDAAGTVTVNAATRTILRSVPAYWRFDARASFDVSRNVQLSVNAQNLTDKAYFSQAYTSHYATIAAGRTVFGTLGLRF